MFTQGDWEINKDTVYGNPVLEISSNAADQWIAHVLNTDYMPGQDNANLFVSAPDMYKALKGLTQLLDSDDPVEVGCHCTDSGDGPIICPWCIAKQALAKSEGR